MRIVGVTGPIAVGKTTFSREVLMKLHGYKVFSCSDTIREMIQNGLFEEEYPEVKKYRGSTRREDFLAFGKELREKYGDAIVVELTIRRAISQRCEKVVVDGVRGPAEIEKIHEYGGFVVYLDAPVGVLYERYLHRKKSMDGDNKTLEKFIKLLEMEDRDFGVSEGRKYADIIVKNDGTLERLRDLFSL